MNTDCKKRGCFIIFFNFWGPKRQTGVFFYLQQKPSKKIGSVAVDYLLRLSSKTMYKNKHLGVFLPKKYGKTVK